MKASGYSVDQTWGEHFGRDHREFELDFGESLTNAIRDGRRESAITYLFGDNTELAAAAISQSSDVVDIPSLPERSLPSYLPEPIELPPVEPHVAEQLDERADAILRKFLGKREALYAYHNPDMLNPCIDACATDEDWRAVAEREVAGEYADPDSEILLVDLGIDDHREAFIERLRKTEPHHEVADGEIDMVWRLRDEIPELASKWFDPQPYDDLPYSENRAKLGDPIALHYQLDKLLSTDPDQEDEHEIVPHELTEWPADLVTSLVPPEYFDKWCSNCVEWAKISWKWGYGGEHGYMKLTAGFQWTEVRDALETKPIPSPRTIVA